MNSNFKFKFLNHVAAKKANKGFTLIELLVVVIIIGVLAAIALPNMLNQVSKGRQAEAKTQLGAANRSQQAYRLENGTFGQLTALDVKVTGQYYDFSSGTVNRDDVIMNAVAKQFQTDIYDYQSGVQNTGTDQQLTMICESNARTTANDAASEVRFGTGITCASNKPVNK